MMRCWSASLYGDVGNRSSSDGSVQCIFSEHGEHIDRPGCCDHGGECHTPYDVFYGLYRIDGSYNFVCFCFHTNIVYTIAMVLAIGYAHRDIVEPEGLEPSSLA